MKNTAHWHFSIGFIVLAAALGMPFSFAQDGGGDGTGTSPDGDCIANVDTMTGLIARDLDWSLGLGTAPPAIPYGLFPPNATGSEQTAVTAHHTESATDPCECQWAVEALRIDKEIEYLNPIFGPRTVTVTFGAPWNDIVHRTCRARHPETYLLIIPSSTVAANVSTAITNNLGGFAPPGDVNPYGAEDEPFFWTSHTRTNTFAACKKGGMVGALDHATDIDFVVPGTTETVNAPDPDVVTESCCPKDNPPSAPPNPPRPWPRPPHQPPNQPPVPPGGRPGV